MKRQALRKDFFMEIKRTFSRFISIFFIVALGVAFFNGIRSAQPDMKISADQFYDQSNLMDIRILGTLGLTDDDVKALENLEGTAKVEGAYSADMLSLKDNKETVIKVLSYPETMNQIVVKEGRIPENPNECIVDTVFLESTNSRVGDTIFLKSGTKDDITDTVKYDTYTITGSCVTSYYLSHSRGTSSIGNGTVNSFIMIPKEAFALETYTEIYMTVDGAKELTSYTKAYDNKVEKLTDEIEDKVSDARIEARYQEVIGEATEKLDEAKEKLAAEEKKAKDKLSDARIKLDDAAKELNDGKAEISKNEQKLQDGRVKITSSEQKLKAGKQELKDGTVKLEKSKKEFSDGEAEYQKGYQEYTKNKKTLAVGREELETARQQLSYITDEQQRVMAEKTLEEKETVLEQGEAELLKAEAVLKASRTKLDQAKVQIAAGEKKLAQSEQTIKNAESEISKAKTEIADGQKKLDQAKLDVADGEKELTKAEKKYEDSKKEAETKIADANAEIHDAEKEIKKIKKPKWYVLDRNSLQTYVEYSQDADRIGAIGDVFPVIFFIVAALVSLTTMTRMVEEERTQIGTLKALGYSKPSIAAKYLMYALLATLGGSIFGGWIGGKILPYVIIYSYRILYKNMEVIAVPLNAHYFILATVLAVLCVTAATVIACFKELAASPAELMRPAAPKLGKRVLLERVTFFWKHLSFTWKSTIRNLVRYKKRFLMTIFGIGGCMALLLVGFGIRDSIFSIVTLQFGQIFKYDAIASMDEDATAEENDALNQYTASAENINDSEEAMQKNMDAWNGSATKTAFLTVFKNTDKLKDYIVLRDRISHKEYFLNNEEAIISEKLASLLHIKAGDTIYLKDDDMNQVQVKVGAVTENYVQHYVYMTPVLYEKLFQEAPSYNERYFITKDSTEESKENFSTELLQNDAVTGITFLDTIQKQFDDMLGSLNIVIFILILSAGGLAFVVLYNLNNINITERIRELATIKVLGFYDMEVSEYVFRENIALTILGGLLGILFGTLLHRFVILTVEVDMTMFGRSIYFMSYVKSLIITFIFAGLINFSMHFKLKKIDMAASLKSVE